MTNATCGDTATSTARCTPTPAAYTAINYADVDFGDPQWNASGVPWSRLYFKDNYPRLQGVKARWDPTDTFRHPQSIRLPS